VLHQAVECLHGGFGVVPVFDQVVKIRDHGGGAGRRIGDQCFREIVESPGGVLSLGHQVFHVLVQGETAHDQVILGRDIVDDSLDARLQLANGRRIETVAAEIGDRLA
jgi:hypothetical protein